MTIKKQWFVALITFATVLTLSACGSNNNASPSASPSESSTAGETKVVTLTATNWKFDQDEIKVHKGDTIKLSIKNESGLHSVIIQKLGVEVKSGETKEFTVTEAGTYEFHCNIMCGQGHDNMSGNIIVE